MKYVAEQHRKFTDMGGVKIHHSIYPVIYPVAGNCWNPIIKFDSKQILAGSQEAQSFVGSPVQIIRMIINGTIAYYDSTGYRTLLTTTDSLLVSPGNEVLQSVLDNSEEGEDAELIEIWLQSAAADKKHEFHSGPAKLETGLIHTVITPNQNDKTGLQVASFAPGDNYEMKGLSADHSVLLFVLNGLVTANGNRLGYRDTIIFCGEDIKLEFESAAHIFMMKMEMAEINKEVVK